MKLRLSDERASDDLLADLRARLDYVVAKEEPRTLGVGVIGSYRDGGRRLRFPVRQAPFGCGMLWAGRRKSRHSR